ncbi:trypsin-like peptidase domain-containing protein [Flavihumibacter sp. ZG627]|uniref:trypsin-like peptidase domain-containing protein n=1 Tax=Flavihumibacter sp. ZG627 TaxID=1463156 RepID=UPI00057FC87B|nr:trypsin-like peptidase domain-containing protein [Flavihumibacter sp. ZG627]
MKYFLWANLICLLLPMLGSAQVLRIITSPTQITSQLPAYSQVSSITSKTISYTPSTPPTPPTPIDEDSTAEESKVYKYADVLSVNIGIADGNITSVSSGKVWTLKINVPNASNIGFIFSQINLSPTAELYIFNESKTVLDSCIKISHFTYTTGVGVFPFTGNSITLYIYEPNNFGTLHSSISIQKLEAGYQPVEDVGDYNTSMMSSQRSISFIPHVICDPSKMQSARAVARFVYNGVLGTGTLVNNEQNNGRAFFLTGFHVVDKNNNNTIDAAEITALQSARFEFSFWNTSCSGSGSVNHALSFSGAMLRAHNEGTDMVLLELLNPPGVGDGVNYAGWNRSTSAPTGNASYIIHHADGESMRLTKTSTVKNWFWNNNYWTAHYNSGVVMPGSSGSALFNQNGSIVGTLRSGWSSCTFTDFGDRYGKFNVSWTAGELQTWLSPNNNHQAANTLVLAPVAISGPAVVPCEGTPVTYSVPNLLGCTITWVVPNTLNIVSGQGTSSIVAAKNGTPTSQPSGFITVTITDSKGRSRSATVNKTVTISFPDVDQLQLVKSGPTCLSAPYQAISLGSSYNGNTGCNLKYNSGITEVE